MKTSQLHYLVEAANEMIVEGFVNQFGEVVVTTEADGVRATCRLRDRAFEAMLIDRAAFDYPSKRTLREAISFVESRLILEGRKGRSNVRLAGNDSMIELDLGTGRFVRIVPDGWEIIGEPRNVFLTPMSARALPDPERGGSVERLRPLLRCATNDDDWLVVQFVLLSALRPTGPQPIVILEGEQGSGKSTGARIIKSLLDPTEPILRGGRVSEDEAMIAAKSNLILTSDNVSVMASAEIDQFCRMSTGGGRGKRALYTDGEEITSAATRMQLITAIGLPTNRPDFVDRTVRLEHPPMRRGETSSESDVLRSFEEAHASILGGLCDMVVEAMRKVGSVEIDDSPRLRDKVEWGMAAVGADGEKLLRALMRNRQAQSDDILASNPVAEVLFAILQRHPKIEETPTALYETFDQQMAFMAKGGTKFGRKDWPKSAIALSKQLKLIAPEMRRRGIEIEVGRLVGTGDNRYRLTRIERIPVSDEPEK